MQTIIESRKVSARTAINKVVKLAHEFNTRLSIVSSTPAPKPEPTSAPVLRLDSEQVKLFAQLIAARRACNEAEQAKRALEKQLDLPRYEGRAQSVAILNPKGKRIGEVQVSFRAGYEVKPGWINKLVSL